MKDCPCRGCGKRTVEPNCHDACGEYTEWLAEVHRQKEALDEWTEADSRRTERVIWNCRRHNAKRRVGQR